MICVNALKQEHSHASPLPKWVLAGASDHVSTREKASLIGD